MPSANRTLLDIRGMLQTYGSERPWHPQVLLTDSLKPTGMRELMSAIAEHQSYVAQTHVTRRGLAEGEAQLLAAVREELEFGLVPNLQRSQAFAEYGKKITDRTIDPYTAALRLIRTLKRQ
jgi:putative protein kinase ArgK-like GTPase of G3E family